MILTLVVAGLAGYRITRLLVEDTILDRPREWLEDRSAWAGSLLSCYWCAGFWIGVALTLMLTFTLSLPLIVWLLLPFAFSALTGILSEIM